MSNCISHQPDFIRQYQSNSSELWLGLAAYLLENQFVDCLFAVLIIQIFSLVSPQVYLTAVVENVE